MHSNIPEIKERLDIVELAGRVTRLRRSGKSYSGLCPFHSERTPSFHVYPESNRYICYGCGAKGSALDFYAWLHDLSIGEAVRRLEEEFGLKRAAFRPLRQPPLTKEDYERIGLVPRAMRELYNEDEEMHDHIALGKIEEQIEKWSSMAESAPEGAVREVAMENCRYFISLRETLLRGREGAA